jgi:tetratricopeptide (TPR) repeat protein
MEGTYKSTQDLLRYLKTLNIESEEHLNQELQKIMAGGGMVPNVNPEGLSFEEMAEDIVHKAHQEKNPAKATELIQKALELDPKSIIAYYRLGCIAPAYILSELCYKEGIRLGELKFDAAFEKENAGHYWMINETRSYMLCLQALMHLQYDMNKDLEEIIAIGEKMLYLNPNDNQGIRDFLFVLLAETNNIEKFEKYNKMFEDETSSGFLFTKLFISINANKPEVELQSIYQKAKQENSHIAGYLLNNKEYLETQMYQFGSKQEAENYCVIAKDLWASEPKAIAWLKKYK